MENLRLIETHQNFEEFISVLWYFDAMITGGALTNGVDEDDDPIPIKINKTDVLNKTFNK